MGTALHREAQSVRDAPGFSARVLATATGASESTVRDWYAQRSEPTGPRAERLTELAVVMKPDAIPRWLQRPIPALESERPVDLIARGDYVPVARVIEGLHYPGGA